MGEEVWKDVIGYEGLYQVSNLGIVKSLRRVDVLGRTVKERIKKPSLNKNGYLHVGLYKNGIHKNCYIHRLVAEAFIPNHNNLPQVNHINAIKEDNSLVNLEWVMQSENIRHAYDNGLIKHSSREGESNSNSKLTEKQVIEIYIRANNGEKHQFLCEEFGVNKGVISKIKCGKTWVYITKDLSVNIRGD